MIDHLGTPRRYNSTQSGISTASTVMVSQLSSGTTSPSYTPPIKNSSPMTRTNNHSPLMPKKFISVPSPPLVYDIDTNTTTTITGDRSVGSGQPQQHYHPARPQAPPQTQTQAAQKSWMTEARKTRIQVCARIRPILPHDRKKAAAAKQKPKSKMKRGLNRSSISSDGGSVGGGGRPGRRKSKGGRRGSVTSNASTGIISPNGSEEDDGAGEGGETLTPVWNVHPDHRSISQESSTIVADSTRTNTYKFDHCFDPHQTTLELYTNTVRDSVRAFMEGYHTSVFAYGQTATGKTFTMTGDDTGAGANSRGIVQLAIQDCFDHIHDERAEGREYLLRVSFMEIYNEVVNDLLVASPPPDGPPTRRDGQQSPVPLASASNIRIFESKREGVVIRGLKEEIVTSVDEVLALLAAGERRRQTGSTQLNRQSSRSHSIFRLTVESRQRLGTPAASTPDRRGSGGEDSIASGKFMGKSSGPVRVSTLSLVDLAGSESVKNTGSKGARQKEGQYINKSLLTLGHVVWKLAELSSKKTDGDGNNLDTTHIPYRDSKLTRLLQPSLSGRAQIVLICNISPIAKHLEESHSTLKFASRAKRIKQNAIITEVVNEKTLLQNYREEIDDLKRQLRDAKGAKSEETGGGGGGGGGDSPTGRGGDNHSGSSGSSAPGEEEETGIIVQAIHNLERLILTTTTAQERKKKKKRKTNKYREDHIFDLDNVKSPSNSNKILTDVIETTGSIHSNLSDVEDDDDDDDEDDGLLLMLDNSKVDLMDLSLVSKSTPRSSSLNTKDDFSLTTMDMSLGDDTIIEGKKLISELQRVQGLLGSVLMRKTPTKMENGLIVRDDDSKTPSSRGMHGATTPSPLVHTHQSSLLLLKNEEVERLRGQLHQQAVATSLRQADSSFLTSQLQEKDTLLQEVSKILESVERRQIQLEKENVGWKEDWAKSVANLRAKESECEKTVSLLKAREAEIQQLRRQLERRNEK